MASRNTPEFVQLVRDYANQGYLTAQIAEKTGKTPTAIRSLCAKHKIRTQYRTAAAQKEFCFLSTRELNKNIKKLKQQLGVESNLIVRQAGADEMACFSHIGKIQREKAYIPVRFL